MLSNKQKIELRRFDKMYMQGISDIELASMFNITIGAVRNRICKLRKQSDNK